MYVSQFFGVSFLHFLSLSPSLSFQRVSSFSDHLQAKECIFNVSLWMFVFVFLCEKKFSSVISYAYRETYLLFIFFLLLIERLFFFPPLFSVVSE